jgi:uncharacterized membrane protein
MDWMAKMVKSRFCTNNAVRFFSWLVLILILFHSLPNQNITPDLTGISTGARADYYALTLNATITEQTTDGKNPVTYVISILNTGNQHDTYTVYADILEITGCSEPDIYEWSISLDKTIISLTPSESAPMVLTVSTSCGCQVGCKATIAIHGISSGDPDIKEMLLIYTTRGPAQKQTGIVVEIDYNPFLSKLKIDSQVNLKVDVYNLQNFRDSILVWNTEGPGDWGISVSPEEFSLQPNSKQSITLSFTIPNNTTNAEYPIAITAQSVSSPSTNGKDKIKVLVRPDIIIQNVTFSKRSIKVGDNIKVKIILENIGLATAKDILILVYDDLEFTPIHKLLENTIASLKPGETRDITIPWHPERGDYNITILINPNSTLDELRTDNNLRIEPINVGKTQEEGLDNTQFYLAFLLILVLIIVWLIIYFRISKRKGSTDDEDYNNTKIKPPMTRRERPEQIPPRKEPLKSIRDKRKRY